MYNENKLNITKNTKTAKKAKKTATQQVETVPAKTAAPVVAKTPPPVVAKTPAPAEVKATTPVAIKPAMPAQAKSMTPVPLRTTAPLEVKAATPVEVKAAVPVVAKPAAPPQPQVVLELVNPAAKQVCVAGSFNDWQPERTPLKPSGNGRWSGDLKVAPGRYEYLFVVDGKWLPDPNARESVQNPFGGKNSVLTVAV